MVVERLRQRTNLSLVEIAAALVLWVPADARGGIALAPFPADREIEGFAQRLDGPVGAHRRAANSGDVAVQGIDGIVVDCRELQLAEPR